MAKWLRFQLSLPWFRFNPWWGNWDPEKLRVDKKKKRERKKDTCFHWGNWDPTSPRVPKKRKISLYIKNNHQRHNKQRQNKTLTFLLSVQSSSVSQFTVSNSLQLHRLQQARLPCPSPTPGACSNWHPSSRWCHPTILSSAIPFASSLQSLPASGSFQMSHFFPSSGQSTGASASASVLPMNIQD